MCLVVLCYYTMCTCWSVLLHHVYLLVVLLHHASRTVLLHHVYLLVCLVHHVFICKHDWASTLNSTDRYYVMCTLS